MYGQLADLLGLDAKLFAKVWRNDRIGTLRASGHYNTFEQCLEDTCREMGVECDASRLPQAIELRMSITRATMAPRPDAVSALRALRDLGCRIGLVSDCSWEVPRVWPETPMAPLVDEAIFSCTAKLKKPDPRLYTLICEKLAVQPTECLYIGDCGSDELAGARQVGMDAALICVPYEENVVMCRQAAKEWNGPRITSVAEVVGLVNNSQKEANR